MGEKNQVFLTEGFLTILMLIVNEYFRLKIHFHVSIHILGISIFRDDVHLKQPIEK